MQTKGQYRVGSTFNPSASGTVDQIKAKAAELIDMIEDIGVPPASSDGEQQRSAEICRLKALAQTEIESAAMWAVKAATKPEKG
ncbi:hypothetical protein JWJ88_17405 [Paracoccus methylovorus]|uniref:Acb2/Tad1 hairpin domain-containing protein n=1 Tax=Paracoccus methylovorus TaxID=2812658 RepID=A0ABX7JQ30_9RHOB|nr:MULTISPECIES: hypothetical protein [Paracoccus]QRZ14742.1 hypothetical protein JWJ88_17405 [Paracoccus methylovorus]